MSNTRAILSIVEAENLMLTLQSNPGVGWQWSFPTGSGPNSLGLFRVQQTGTPQIVCLDNHNSGIVMILDGIPARPVGSFPFSMQDQTPTPRQGSLNVVAANMPLPIGGYTWRILQVSPSAYIQSAVSLSNRR